MPLFEVQISVGIKAIDEITAADIIRARLLDDDQYPIEYVEINSDQTHEITDN